MGDAVEENAHQQYGERGARGGKEGSAETDNAAAVGQYKADVQVLVAYRAEADFADQLPVHRHGADSAGGGERVANRAGVARPVEVHAGVHVNAQGHGGNGEEGA